MERFKWIFLFTLFIVFIVAVVKPKKWFEKKEQSNIATIEISYEETVHKKTKPLFIQKGRFEIPVEIVQIITGRTHGWHIECQKPIDDIYMFLLIDIADTSKYLVNHDKLIYAHTIENNYVKNLTKRNPVSRHTIKFGFFKKIDKYTTDVRSIPFKNFACKIENLQYNDTTISVNIGFSGSCEPLLDEIFQVRYFIRGRMKINNFRLLTRET